MTGFITMTLYLLLAGDVVIIGVGTGILLGMITILTMDTVGDPVIMIMVIIILTVGIASPIIHTVVQDVHIDVSDPGGVLVQAAEDMPLLIVVGQVLRRQWLE